MGIFIPDPVCSVLLSPFQDSYRQSMKKCGLSNVFVGTFDKIKICCGLQALDLGDFPIFLLLLQV